MEIFQIPGDLRVCLPMVFHNLTTTGPGVTLGYTNTLYQDRGPVETQQKLLGPHGTLHHHKEQKGAIPFAMVLELVASIT
jgi:hypothetical protein